MKDSARQTVDMTPEQHMCIKRASAKIGIPVRELVLRATLSMLDDLEDEWLAAEADEILKKIESGEEKVISWKAAKKRLNNLF